MIVFDMSANYIKCILLISGKRKSGKDFIANEIVKTIGDEHCVIVRLSAPIKRYFSQKYGLDFSELLSSSEYKEKIRREMIEWGEKKRIEDEGIFCKTVIEDAMASKKPVWILSDARRTSDVRFFKSYAARENTKLFCIRVSASDDTRINRGWKFLKGVDDAESECGLDGYMEWDYLIDNSLNCQIMDIVENFCKNLLESIGLSKL